MASSFSIPREENVQLQRSLANFDDQVVQDHQEMANLDENK